MRISFNLITSFYLTIDMNRKCTTNNLSCTCYWGKVINKKNFRRNGEKRKLSYYRRQTLEVCDCKDP